MKIFRVTAEVEVEVFVVAADELDADGVAHAHAEEALEEREPYTGEPHEISDLGDVPQEWRNSLPYGSEDNRTITEILTAEPAEPEPVKDTWTVPMFPESNP